jgi:hypothetical protein
MNNYALYYPTIEFTNHQWLWSASLLWDRLYRIVPTGYQPDDPPNVLALMESGEIGIPLHPDDYAPLIAEEFIARLDSGEWNAAALTLDMPDEYRRLHTDKVDVVLRDMIIAHGAGKAQGEWLHVPTDFAAHYMTYLANAVAERNKLQMLSDSAPAWAGATYFKYNGQVEDFPRDEFTQQLATMVVREFLPSDILSIKPKDILSFREKYRAERQRLLTSMQTWAKRLSECDDDRVAQDLIQDMNKDIEASLKDFRGSLSALNVAGMTGLKSLTFPVVTKVASLIGGKDLDPSTLLFVAGASVALGLVSGLSDWNQKRKKLTKECDYSYLMHMRKQWKGIAMYDKDYNYYLCRKMEEFIND